MQEEQLEVGGLGKRNVQVLQYYGIPDGIDAKLFHGRKVRQEYDTTGASGGLVAGLHLMQGDL